MPAPRFTAEDFTKILGRKGYGIASQIGKKAITPSVDSKREAGNLEQGSGYESLRAQTVALNYTGKCIVRIKFFRKRLADYSRANCEKYAIDALVYGGAIRDDSEKEIQLIDEGQYKVATDAEERIEINLEYESVDLDNLWVPRERIGNIGK